MKLKELCIRISYVMEDKRKKFSKKRDLSG